MKIIPAIDVYECKIFYAAINTPALFGKASIEGAPSCYYFSTKQEAEQFVVKVKNEPRFHSFKIKKQTAVESENNQLFLITHKIEIAARDEYVVQYTTSGIINRTPIYTDSSRTLYYFDDAITKGCENQFNIIISVDLSQSSGAHTAMRRTFHDCRVIRPSDTNVETFLYKNNPGEYNRPKYSIIDFGKQIILTKLETIDTLVRKIVNKKPAVHALEIIKEILQELTPAVRAYLDSFKDKEKHTEMVGKLQLSQQEENLLEEYIDSKTLEVTDIPVSVNGNLYEFQTLLDQPVDPNGQRQELITEDMFYLRDIQPARHTVTAITNILKEIQEKRNKMDVTDAPESQAAGTMLVRKY